jgi:predicted ATPase
MDATIGGLITIIGGVILFYLQRYYKAKDEQEKKAEEKSSQKQSDVLEESIPVPSPASDTVTQVHSLSNIIPLDNKFVGRESDILNLRKFLNEENHKVVSVIGTGGIGKTRLVREYGYAHQKDFKGGIWFVDLTETKTIGGLAYAIFSTFESEYNSSQIEPWDAVVDLLKDRKQSLLVLDNFEQIAEWADETIAFWVKTLNNICFLITTRTPLKIQAEHRYYLNTLSQSDYNEDEISAIQNSNSVKLFTSRCEQIGVSVKRSSDLKIVNKICNQLQGLPLAIEIVAAKCSVMSIQDVHDRLDQAIKLKNNTQDRKDIHITLEATIKWSYDLLNTAEQETFRLISVFQDGFSLKAAEMILPSGQDVIEYLGTLVDQSLLKLSRKDGQARYEMLVSTNDFASSLYLDQMLESDRVEYEMNYANYFLKYACTNSEKIFTEDGNEILDQLSIELENIFLAQDLFLKYNDVSNAAKIILCFAPVLENRGPAPLRIPRLQLSFDAYRSTSELINGDLAYQLSRAYWARGSWNEGESYSDLAVATLKASDDRIAIAKALRQQGMMRKERGYLRRSLPVLREALEIFKSLDYRSDASACLTYIGAVQERLGEFEQALTTFELAEDLAILARDNIQHGLIYNRRGLAYWHHGFPNKALESFKTAEKVSNQAGNKQWVVAHRTNKALVLADLGKLDEAIKLSESTDSLHTELGTIHWAAVNFAGRGRAKILRNADGDIDSGIELLYKALKIARKIYYPENISWHVGDLARAYNHKGDYLRAYKYVEEAISLERRMGATHEHRHFSNLVMLSYSTEKLNREDELWEALIRAVRLQEQLQLDTSSEMQRVRSDVATLNKLVEVWRGKNIDKIDDDCDPNFAKYKLCPPKIIGNVNFRHKNTFELLSEVEQLGNRPAYEYPWNGLESDLVNSEEKSLLLFGYGSLLNKISAERTINKETVALHKPMISFGMQRIFDYNMPDAVRSRSHYTINESKPKHIALFNARYTGSLCDSSNGVLFRISIDDIPALREREVGYDLVPIVCVNWKSDYKLKVRAYTLGCSGRLWKGKMLSDESLLPNEEYYHLCRSGAEAVSKEFLDFYLKTSYLADRITPIIEYENNN